MHETLALPAGPETAPHRKRYRHTSEWSRNRKCNTVNCKKHHVKKLTKTHSCTTNFHSMPMQQASWLVASQLYSHPHTPQLQHQHSRYLCYPYVSRHEINTRTAKPASQRVPCLRQMTSPLPRSLKPPARGTDCTVRCTTPWRSGLAVAGKSWSMYCRKCTCWQSYREDVTNTSAY